MGQLSQNHMYTSIGQSYVPSRGDKRSNHTYYSQFTILDHTSCSHECEYDVKFTMGFPNIANVKLTQMLTNQGL